MVRAVTFSVIAMGALADDKEYMISGKGHSGQCVLCQPTGNLEFDTCDTGHRDQKFRLVWIDSSEVGGATNGYVIRSVDTGLCLATNNGAAIFGWTDCSTTDQGPTGGFSGRAWLLTEQKGGFRFENAHFPGNCVTTDLVGAPCGDGDDQTFQFDPPFNLNAHGTSFSSPEGLWHLAASNNADISKSLTIGMSYTDGTTVTDSDQIGLGYSMAMEGTFLGLGATETLSAEYSHTWSTEVMQSSTTTSSEECTASCHSSDLPKDAPGWNLLQWEMRGTAAKGVLSTRMCNYLCLPQPMQPKCPVNCCQDRNCQTCSSCFKDSSTDVMV